MIETKRIASALAKHADGLLEKFVEAVEGGWPTAEIVSELAGLETIRETLSRREGFDKAYSEAVSMTGQAAPANALDAFIHGRREPRL